MVVHIPFSGVSDDFRFGVAHKLIAGDYECAEGEDYDTVALEYRNLVFYYGKLHCGLQILDKPNFGIMQQLRII